MRRRPAAQIAAICLLAATAGGCGKRNYTVVLAPVRPVEAYQDVRVGPVTTEITTDSLAVTDLMDVRNALQQEIAKEKHIRRAELEADGPGWLDVECTITEFAQGSRATRMFTSRFGGGATLRMTCGFKDTDTNEMLARADFHTEVKGGLFGGSANPEGMGRAVGKYVAEFLKRGGR